MAGSGMRLRYRILGWNPRHVSGDYADASFVEFARLGDVLVQNVKAVTPVSPFKTAPGPHLVDTVHAETTQTKAGFGLKVVVGDGIKYLRLIIDGYPNDIFPATASVLKFVGYAGSTVYSPSVRGQDSNPFNLSALEHSRQDIKDASERMILAATRKFAENFVK